MLPLLALMGASAMLSARQAEQKKKQQQDNNRLQAELTRYSPWTGMQGQIDSSYIPDALTAGAGGALQGAAIGQGFGMGGMTQPGQMPMQVSQGGQVAQQGYAGYQNPGMYGTWGNIG